MTSLSPLGRGNHQCYRPANLPKASSLSTIGLHSSSLHTPTMQARRLWISSTLASITYGQTYITATATPVPPTAPSPTCTQEACATYTNECGIPYGGCYPLCPGNTIPAFTPPPCPTTTTTTTSSYSSRCPTACWDLINSCSMWYGGCSEMCGSYSMPSFTPPPCPTTTTSTAVNTLVITGAPAFFTGKTENRTFSCATTVCWDHHNQCGLKYGGCHPDCDGMPTPSYTNPGCPASSPSSVKTFSAQTANACGMYCPIYVDGCGQSFGPGCYTSCSGVAPPSFTTPYCETSAVTTMTTMTTSV